MASPLISSPVLGSLAVTSCKFPTKYWTLRFSWPNVGPHRKISKRNFVLSHFDFYDNPLNSMIEMKMPWWGMAVKGVLGRGKPRQPHGKVGARLALESISSSPNLQSFDGSQLSSELCKSILVHKLTSIDAPYVTHVLYSCNSCVPVPAHQYCTCNPSQCPHPPQPWPLILPPLSLVRPIYHLWYVMIFSLIVKRTMIWSVSILTHSWQHCFQSSENAWKMPG